MSPEQAIEAAVEETLLPSSGELWVGCSGGADSMALVEAVRQTGRWRVRALIIDHGIQAQSASWAAAVSKYWRAKGVECTVVRGEVAAGGNLEARARAYRYKVFEDVAREGVVLTAHTADDQAETLLMRLADGAGVPGLAGILAHRGSIRRPWLGVERSAVRAYAQARELPIIEDPANIALRYRRSRLRVLAGPPLAKALGPRWVRGAAVSAKNAADASALINALGQTWLAQIQTIALGVRLSPEGLQAPMVIRSWLVRQLLKRSGVGGRRVRPHLKAVLAVASGALRSHTLPGSGFVKRTPAGLEITWASEPVEPLSVSGFGEWPFGIGVVGFESVEGLPDQRDSGVIRLLPQPWRLRAPQPGDRYRPWGGGSRAVGRALRDAGVPARLRAGWPVLEIAGRVVWVAGLRIDEQAAVPPRGGPAVRIHWRCPPF